MPYTKPQANALKQFKSYKITKHHDDGDLSIRGLRRGNWESYVVTTSGSIYKKQPTIIPKRPKFVYTPIKGTTYKPKQRPVYVPYVPSKKPRQQMPMIGPYKRG